MKGKRGCRERLNRAASNVSWLYERDVNQIQHRQVPQTAASTGPSPHLSSSACFLQAPSNASLHWNEGPLYPLPVQQAIKIKEPNTLLSCCWWTRVEGKAFLYSSTPLPQVIPLTLPPTFQLYPNGPSNFSASSQPLCCLHPFMSPLPFPLHLPTTHFRGSSIVSQRGTCCYWLLSGDVWGTSVDAISSYFALLKLWGLHVQLAGKWDVWRRLPEENGASSSAEMIWEWMRDGQRRMMSRK